MQAIHIRDKQREREHEQQEVPNQKVGTPKGQLDNLDHELAGRLAHRVCTETTAVPLTSPPCAVRLVVLELARKEDCNKNLVDGALDENDGDKPEHSVRGIPELEEPLKEAR